MSCATEPLTDDAATCTVTYPSTGSMPSPPAMSGTPTSSARIRPPGGGQRRSFANWRPGHDHRDDAVDFLLHAVVYRGYTNLVVNGAPHLGATVLVKCERVAAVHSPDTTFLLAKSTRCGNKPADVLRPASSFDVTPGFASRRLAVGARVTVEIADHRTGWGVYRFTMRARRRPGVQIAPSVPRRQRSGRGLLMRR